MTNLLCALPVTPAHRETAAPQMGRVSGMNLVSLTFALAE